MTQNTQGLKIQPRFNIPRKAKTCPIQYIGTIQDNSLFPSFYTLGITLQA